MRKAVLGLAVILCFSAMSFSQNPRQWKVVQTLARFNQTAPIPQTVIVTPSVNSIYRLSAYISSSSEGSSVGWTLLVEWTNLYGAMNGDGVVSQQNEPNENVVIFSAKAGEPVSYQVSAAPQPEGIYTFVFTIEQLQ